MSMGWVLAVSLGLTLLTEVPVAYLWGLRGRHDLTVAVLANVLTNPAAVTLAALGAPVWLLEAAAAGVEALCYRGCCERVRYPLLLSLCANAVSCGLGRLL